MRKSIPMAIMAVLLATSGALAQSKSGTSGPTTPSATTNSGNIPNAPVGHRQPRASDVPTLQEKNYTESAEDKALDRKIKSICRGC
ncbi:hypothetical protein YH63_018080 [Afipia massiliensis]|uniref:DUF680 domain-containing protein n=1 Tax=Afipia massiliensis TaxID=211460 RepID=A0A4U6BRH0_9BRAD|nr:hypothetical protein [Afipia massiliensis]TKT73180.1 hypothetical protein YH63_018080 [Afipia massiliensis]